jgi:hypothetical protein
LSYPDEYPSQPAGYRINFAGRAVRKSSLIPADYYLATITKVEWKRTSEESQTPNAQRLDVTFRISAGEHEGTELVKVYVPDSAKAWPFFYGLCQATGNFTDDELDSGDFGCEDMDKKLLGATVALRVDQKESDFSDREDGLRNEVGRVVHPNSPRGRKVAQAAEAASYDPRMP